MSFEETRFPENISYSSSGGPGYRTEVVVLESGREQRVGKWTNGRHMYNINAIKTDADFDAVIDFFHAMRGRLIGFRFKDWGDWKSNGIDPTSAVTPTDQVIGTGDGSTAVFQLVKNYTVGGQTYARPITKPVNGTLRVAVDSVEKTETTHWTCD